MKKDRLFLIIFAIFSFLIPFIIYFSTANPYLSFTDNGELMAVCVTLGIPHPTGYPLFTMLGHLWSLLPLCSSKIFQMNLLSALWTALAATTFFFAVVSLYKTLHSSTRKLKKASNLVDVSNWKIYLLGLISSLTFAFGKTIWIQATSLEVYSFQLLLFNLIILCSLESIRLQHNPNITFLLFFLLGLAFSNHLTTILILPSLAFLLFFRSEDKIFFSRPSLKSLLLLIIPFIVGISPYLYLLFRSSQFPIFNWGWVSRSFDKFFYHVSGKQYRVWMFSSTDAISENLKKFLNDLPYEFAYIGLVLVLIGVGFLLFRNRYILIYLLISFISCLIYSLNYQIHDIETYFSLAFIVLFLFFGAGLFLLWERFRNYSFIFAIVPFFLIWLNYKENDDSKNNLALTYTKNVIDNLEKNAIIISAQWDYFCSPFWYLQQVEGYRKDVVLIEKELLRRTWYLEQLKRWYPQVINKSNPEITKFMEQLELFESEKPYDAQEIQFRFENLLSSFVAKNIDERPVYITFDVLQNEYDRRPFLEYEQVPQGFAIRLLSDFRQVETDFKKINTKPFEYFISNKNHLVQGIIQATATNLVYLESYYRIQGKIELSDSLLRVIDKLHRGE